VQIIAAMGDDLTAIAVAEMVGGVDLVSD
jgi:hypothetical protein